MSEDNTTPVGIPTDQTLAEEISATRDNMFWCPQRKAWYRWTGKAWDRADGEPYVYQSVVACVRARRRRLAEQPADEHTKKVMKEHMGYESNGKVRAVMAAMSQLPELRRNVEQLDARPELLNCANGIVDLRTGTLGPHDKKAYQTLCTGVDYMPGARSELWERYLCNLTGGDAELYAYLQRAAGLSLWGFPIEKAFFFLHGVPDSGKSRFLDALRAALGPYVATASFETWLQQTNVGGNRGDLVSLMGSRIVVSSEVRDSSKINSELIKQVTGGDTLKAAAKFENDVEIRPTFTLWWAANDAPRVRAEDSGFWKRARVLSCTHAVPAEQQIKNLDELWREPEHAQAILAWLVQGCLAYRAHGLPKCSAVDAAIKAYRDSQDPTTAFWEECVITTHAESFVERNQLWNAWSTWVEDNGDKSSKFVSRKELFAKALTRPVVVEHKKNGMRGFKGMALVQAGAPPLQTGGYPLETLVNFAPNLGSSNQ